MRTKHLLFLTLLLCSLLLAYTSIADAQKVHACLILLGPIMLIRFRFNDVVYKSISLLFSLLLIFGVPATLIANEGANGYFPHTLGSFWVYEDQDGNKLTRRAVEKKTIEGETYHAFSYEPALEDWADYDYHIHPHLYQVGEERVTFWVGDEVEKALKARLTREVEALGEIHAENFDLLYDIEVEAQDEFYVLPTSVTFNEKWDAAQIKAKITLTPDPPQDPEKMIFELTIVETGKVLGTENVETPAGTFEDCLKIEYWTATEVSISPLDAAEELDPPGESVTMLWVAPNVGIVKFYQEAEDILLKVAPLGQFMAATTVKTLKLKRLEPVADAQKVHACLILLGNDPKPTYRASVDINQEAMIGLMEIVSRNADVHMTLMKSEPGRSGEVTHTHLVKMETKARTPTDQLSIIKPAQVTQWIRNLKVGPSDTVFIYFNGHGKVNRYGTHQLLFDKTGTKQLARDVVLEALRETPCRLKMLITDTCSTVQNTAHPAGRKALAWYGDIEAKPQFYARNLFLEHTGTLDITATSPEIRTASDTDKAYGDDQVGGFFTYALTHALVPAADKNQDDFLSWEEVFAATQEGTKWLCETHPLVKPLNTIQRPVDHTLPTPRPVDHTLPPKPPKPTPSTAILNFTSVPSGATVSIDNAVVGKTPLTDYEIEMDGGSTKEIKVTIKASGYEDSVETFRVQRGKPLNWKFELTKKVTDIPKTIRGQDGAEMVLSPAGEFQMGSNDGYDDEKPGHTVHVDAFYMDKYEVTNAQYKRFVDANPQWRKDRIEDRFHHGDYLKHWNGNDYPAGKADHPVVYVSWYAAMAYAEWTGKRLPTEAEWEKAARGGLAEKKYPWGDTIDASKVNYYSSRDGSSSRVVGSYAPNGYGLYDMAGNVREWCLDRYDPNFYEGSPERNPIPGGSIQFITDNYKSTRAPYVVRGGSWRTNENGVRCARRDYYTPAATSDTIGFRCVRAVQ